MNELIFLLHIIITSLLVLGALRLGKEALIVLFCLQGVIANLFIFKQIVFFGLTITCTDAYIIGSYFSLGLLQHYYGKDTAHKAITLSVYALILFLLASIIHLFYEPSIKDTYHIKYQELLQTTPRVFISSLVVGFTAQKLSVYIQEFFKQKNVHKIFILILPIIVSQFYDTLTFSYLGLYGVVYSLWDIILISYIIKLLAILCIIPFTLLSKKIYPIQQRP